MRQLSTRALVLLGIVTALALTALSLGVVALAGAGREDAGCATPVRNGTIVSVVATDGAGERPYRMPMSAPFRDGGLDLRADRSAVPHGQVTFQLSNSGWMPHEMMVLPLASGQTVGSRPVGRDGRVEEQDSLGHALPACGEGNGTTIRPGGTGWLTLDLPPGRYELLCNIPGHYAAGMRTELRVN